MAAQIRESVKVFVHPPNDTFKAIATLFFSSAVSTSSFTGFLARV